MPPLISRNLQWVSNSPPTHPPGRWICNEGRWERTSPFGLVGWISARECYVHADLEAHLESIDKMLETVYDQSVPGANPDAAQRQLMKVEQLGTRRRLPIYARDAVA